MPKVSIVCITYNQEKFIRQALESFIMQKTDFDFEVIIGDDCSTDNTQKIIKEFELKYPNIIKPIYRIKNIGIMANFIDALDKAEGDYIALCEGDDFFTEQNKLQIQSDFLDNNLNYSLCFHPVKVFFENKEEPAYIFPNIKNYKEFSVLELLKGNFIQTNSVMYRKQINYKNIPINILPGDWYLHLYHAHFGQIGFINKIMSAYRKHEKGIWWNSYKDVDQLLIKHGIAHLRVFVELLKIYTEEKQKNILQKNINYWFNKLSDLDRKYNSNLINLGKEEFPELYIHFLKEKQNNVFKNEIISIKNKTIDKLCFYTFFIKDFLKNKLKWPRFKKID